MSQINQASIVASSLRCIDAGGFINTQLDKAATLIDSQHARILELEAELLTEKRHQRTRDVAAVRTLGALGYNWNGGEAWQAAPNAAQPFGYVNTYTGQFFSDVEPCRKNNEGHWRTVYSQPAAQGLDAKGMSEWLLARRSHLGSSRESAHWGEKCWDNYTMLSKYFAAQAKQGAA